MIEPTLEQKIELLYEVGRFNYHAPEPPDVFTPVSDDELNWMVVSWSKGQLAYGRGLVCVDGVNDSALNKLSEMGCITFGYDDGFRIATLQDEEVIGYFLI